MALKSWDLFLISLLLAVLSQVAEAAGSAEAKTTQIEVENTELLPISAEVARQQLQNLMDQGMDLLVSELVHSGTFYPFAIMLGHDGDIRLIGTPADQRGEDPQAVVSALVKTAQKLAKQKRVQAVAFFMDYVASRRDTGFSQAGIRVELDHIQPDSLSVFIPYSITTDKKLRLMTPQYNPGKNVVFQP